MTVMIDSPQGYFRQFIPPRDELLRRLEAEAEREKIPIVGPVIGEMLRFLARISRAQTILELGTASGYSAIYMAKGCAPWKGKIITLEKDPAFAERARKNFESGGIATRVDIRIGDALETITAVDPPIDMIFMDIEKSDYLPALAQCERLLKEDGLLIADNVAFKDAQPFVQKIFESPAWRPIHLYSFMPSHSPENDALTLALRVGS